MKFSLMGMALTLLMMVITILDFVDYQNWATYEVEEQLLDIQVNYSVEAAAQAMLESSLNVGLSYDDWGRVELDPQAAFETYKALLLRNFGWGDNPKYRQEIEQYAIPYFCVAGYDGYYLYSSCRMDEKNGVTYELKCSPKIPYSYKNGSNLYALNFGASRVDVLNTSSYKATKNVACPISKAEVVKRINLTLSDEITKAMYQRYEGNFDSRYLTAIASNKEGYISVENPTVLTSLVVDGSMTRYGHAISGFGGAKITEADDVVCYVVDGKKYYHYKRNVVGGKIRRNQNSGGTWVTYQIVDTFKTEREAIANGYKYDLVLLGR